MRYIANLTVKFDTTSLVDITKARRSVSFSDSPKSTVFMPNSGGLNVGRSKARYCDFSELSTRNPRIRRKPGLGTPKNNNSQYSGAVVLKLNAESTLSRIR